MHIALVTQYHREIMSAYERVRMLGTEHPCAHIEHGAILRLSIYQVAFVMPSHSEIIAAGQCVRMLWAQFMPLKMRGMRKGGGGERISARAEHGTRDLSGFGSTRGFERRQDHLLGN